MNYTQEVVASERRDGRIKIHGPEGFEGMRRAGRLAAECLDMLTPHVVPGVSTKHLDDLAREFVLDHGAYPACLFYKGYGHTVCISPNHVVCHGIPGSRTNAVLTNGDIANIDVTVVVDGWHGDTSRMYPVGEVKSPGRRLIDVTYEGMMRGLAVVKPGVHLNEIGRAIQTYVESQRCSVVTDFCGHGVGKVFHDAPNVLHYLPFAGGEPQMGPVLEVGMFFTVEPMVNLGRSQTKVLQDGWTAVTRDKSLSAQCEHSCGVTETGIEIFTASPMGIFRPDLS